MMKLLWLRVAPVLPARLGGLLFTTLLSHASGIEFPGAKSAVSPDLQWRVTCDVDRANEAVSLYLTRGAGTQRHLLHTTDRWCELLWNGGTPTAALTDWEGSNQASIYIVDLTAPERKQDILLLVPTLVTVLTNREMEGHCYWEALAWEAPDILRVRSFGHTDQAEGHTFCYTFRVNVRDRTHTLLAKDLSDHAEESAWKSKQPVPVGPKSGN